MTLLVARPVAIWIALAGTRTDTATKAFMAWFGPKGVATMTFSLLVLLGRARGERIFNIAALVVFCSILAHGLTDTPGSEWMARSGGRRGRGEGAGTRRGAEGRDRPPVDVGEAVAAREVGGLGAGAAEAHRVGVGQDGGDGAADELGECVSGGGSAPCCAKASTTASVRVKPGYDADAATPCGRSSCARATTRRVEGGLTTS